jgi:translation initiation factor 2 subunit 2
MEKDYKSMLTRAYDELPEQSFEEQDRFQVPRARVTQQGRRSIIMNFNEIAETIQRDPEHLLKFLLKETATRGNYDGTRVVFQGKFTQDSIRNLIEIYTNKYVICPVCGRPDTHIVRDKRLSFLQCDACGARSSIGKS